MPKIIYSFFCLLYLLLFKCANAQLPVNRLGVDQGLSNETIRSIYQDGKGFMWFGTLDGLNRYDGYGFKVYHNKFKDTSSLLSNVIYGITEDRQGNLWLGTRSGVCRLNYLQDDFTTVYYKNEVSGKLLRLDREVIKTISCDAQNNILIASELQGLMICKNAATAATQVPFVGTDDRKNYQYGVQAICYDSKGQTLVFVQGKGLCRFNYQINRLELLSTAVSYVNSLLAEGNEIWMATNEGVFAYDISTRKTNLRFSVQNAKLNSNLCVAIVSGGNKFLYIGTMGGGLNIYNKHTGLMSYLTSDDGRNGLSSGGIYALYADKTRIWVGTRRGGINVIDHGREKFTTISREPGNANSLSGNFITSVCEMPNGDLLVGTEENGLNVLEKSTSQFLHYQYNPANPNSISSNNVNHILMDHTKKIWLATYTNGVCSFDPATKRFQQYKTINPKTGVENKVFNVFYEDAQKNLWTTALRRGNHFGALYRYNREADRVEIFDDRLSDLFSLKEDREGNFWGGGLTDLLKIDRIHKRHQTFYIGQFIRTITDGGNGKLWLGTEGGGLVLFDTHKNIIISRFTKEQGLSNNSIFSTLQDDKGNLWLGTFNGLSRFDIAKKTFKNYYRSDGLESDQFHFNAATKLRSGAFVFGGISGYNVFYPDSIDAPIGNAPLRFTGFIVDGKPIQLQQKFISKTANSSIAGIAVPYNNAVLSFDFAALEYSVPNKILYAYYLDGWDKGWNYTGNIHTASYTHLREGSYVFRVKSTDGNGVWKNEISIPVTIFPPWYRSWWAYLFYLGVIGSLIYIYLRYRTRQAQLQYEVNLEKINVKREKAEREKEAAELAREKAEHEKYAAELETEKAQRVLERAEREAEKALADKEREASERRAAFFTNISHEFRTPLTLIINPIKDILGKAAQLPEGDDKQLKVVYRNARRMLSLTNQLLMLRREESGLDQVHPVKLDLVSLCDEVFLCFVQQAQSRNISYEFHCSEKEIEVYADKDKMEMIFYNLLSNALKYTPQSGKITLSIINEEQEVLIAVTDNGRGIAPAAKERVFEKFYQAKDTDSNTKPGFGIGLYLVKQFTDAHHGTVTCADTPGGGTTFSVRLAKGSAHFTQEELAYNKSTIQTLLEEMAPVAGEDEKSATILEEMTESTGSMMASEKQSVLVVDDDESIRDYLKLIFADIYKVYEAPNGREGIQTAEKLFPDIIISDIMMEDLNGIDLCKSIKENPSLSHIPVVLLTGTSSEDLKLQGVQGGADDYIMKPFDKELLIARVSNLLKARNSLQRYFYNEITLSNQDSKISEQFRQFLDKCIEVIEQDLDDEKFNGKKLAQQLGISYSSMTKRVKAISGQSLNSFIRFVRLRKAARLFIDTNYNVNEVAGIVGIFDNRYFREQFSKQFNMNPSDFIKKYRKPFANKYTVNKDVLNKGGEA